eukprot:TRINITY_DN93656_c0_g1_i1.p1 TRINITY_DN93656_c0_g1~~TRINITY_DN93656_c0_g1_i1.p1  ORF type:complete len:430 (+),score=47.63 TRINITY_DN93656_c0_g1_i1:62-1351(+)
MPLHADDLVSTQAGGLRRHLTETAPAHAGRSSVSAWEQENALQGATGGHRDYQNAGERLFSSKIRVRKYVKYYEKQVLNYDMDRIMGIGVFAASCASASLLGPGKCQLKCDVLIVVVLSLASMSMLLLGGIELADLDLQKINDLVRDFHTLATFLLGFYVTTCLSRWWAIRNDCIGALWGSIDDLSLLVGSYFGRDTDADRQVREQVLRWGVLSHELVYKQARADANLADLVEIGLLTDHEQALLEQLSSKPQVIWAWMCSYFAHLAYGERQDGGSRLPYPVTTLPQLHEICRKARGAIGQAFAYTDTQVPFRYVHFLSLLIWVHNFFQAVNSALVMAHAVKNRDTLSFVIEFIFLFWYPLVYLGLLHLGAGMLNPLRCKQDIDFPHGAWKHFMIQENHSFFVGSTQPHGPPYGRPPVWRPDASEGQLP